MRVSPQSCVLGLTRPKFLTGDVVAVTILVPCPICEGRFGGKCQKLQAEGDTGRFKCDACGEFRVSGSLLAGQLSESSTLTPLQRAALAHRVRTAGGADGPPLLKSDWFERFLEASTLPTPSEQATNIVRLIGDEVLKTGEPIDPSVAFAPTIGAPSTEFANRLAIELIRNGMLLGSHSDSSSSTSVLDVDLTLRGWQVHEAERRGRVAGSYGFVALRFGNEKLDGLLKNTVRPAVRDSIKYELVDMRDVATAGVIDNIMRERIRDAAFVLADLTDDNPGAYWEAGFAEGLGKPVIYLCEKAKFAEAKTHFDTNHCTTVMWDVDAAELFAAELIATIRNSLNLFPTK